MEEMLKFVNSSPPDIAKIALLYLSIEDQRAIYDALMELSKERPLSSEEKSATIVVGTEVLADATEDVGRVSGGTRFGSGARFQY